MPPYPRRPNIAKTIAARASLAAAFLMLGAVQAADPFPLLYTEAKHFKKAHAEVEARLRPLDQHITGVTVPHHLLALDLIAETLFLASAGDYERILILSPDHFKRGTTPFSTTARDFLTPLGRVPVDRDAVRDLLQVPLVSESGLFSREHGIQAILPSIARFFPGVPIVPVTLGVRSAPEEWESLLPALIACAKERRTLVVQSTDFSHYFTQAEAMRHDEVTLRVLSAGDAERVKALNQPGHLDSKAAQWLMMRIQSDTWSARGTVLQNRNAIHYGGGPDEPSTTSYITQIYSPDTIPGNLLPGIRFCFAGDTHFARGVATKLAHPDSANRIAKSILDATGGAPLILNLEGVILDRVPDKPAHPFQIGMPKSLTLDWLRNLNVKAVSLANNHSQDFGPAAFDTMVRHLKTAGITTVPNGAVVDLGHFRLGAATDVENSPAPARDLLHKRSFDAWGSAAPPLFAFLHCGAEYAPAPTLRERLVASWAESQGARLILGAHTHRPSPGWELGPDSLRWFSMGNLLFDQNGPRNGGGICEVRFLDQGTWTARWIPLGNLFAPRQRR